MRRRLGLVRTISMLGLAAVLAVPTLAQESGQEGGEKTKPPIRVKVVSPKAEAERNAPRIPVRLVLPENAGGPVVTPTATPASAAADGAAVGAADEAVDIVIGGPAAQPAPTADAPQQNAVQQSSPQNDDRAPAPGPSLFDQLVAPSWSGGAGFDRAPWPEETAPTEARVVRAPAPVETQVEASVEAQVAPASQPPNGEVVEPGYEPEVAYAPSSDTRTDTAGDDYLLGPGDRVDVFVWRNPDLSRQVPVRPDGRITLPLAGEVYAAGKTVAALRDEITRRLGDYIQMPTVTVTIAEIRSLVVYVLGDVRTPGAVQMDRNLTVLQAIAAAGGLNEFADRNDIVVMRTAADGTAQRWTFRYDDVVQGKRLETNIVLQAGDTIIVP